MWNGLWKLAVMVGVIGIGLFAAYQAQKGMNLTVADATGESGDKAERALEPALEKSAFDLSMDQDEPEIAPKSDLEPVGRTNSRRVKNRAERPVDPLDDFADSPTPAKNSIVSNDSASSPSIDKGNSAKRKQRRLGVDFREDTDSFGETVKTSPSISDDFDSEDPPKKVGQSIKQVSAESTDDGDQRTTETANMEVEADPFAEDNSTGDVAPKVNSREKLDVRAKSEVAEPAAEPDAMEFADDVATKKTSAANGTEKTRIEYPSPPAGKAKISTDTDLDSEPPRSKRAKQNAGRRAEARAETESNPFESDSQAPASQTSPTSSTSLDRANPDVGTPARVDEPVSEVTVTRQEPSPAVAPRSLPDDISTISNDNGTPSRELPKRGRLAAPATLSDDSSAAYLNEPSPRSRDAQPRRANRDQISSAVDMVGDGVLGDASQRGLQQPRLTIEKVAQQQAVIDQPFIYSIIVKNTGSVDAHNVVIEDRIPKGTELLGTAPQAELAGKRLIWNQLILKPNEEKKISIKVVPKQEGPVGSVARVYFATEVSAEIVVAAPQLEFTVKAPGEVRVGQHFDLIFTLKNVGTVDATNIKVQDLVPDELKHEAGSDIECPIGKMAPQDCREIVLPVVAMKTGSVVNKAYLSADSGIKKSLDSGIEIIGEVLVLTRTGQNRLYVEKPAAFTNNIRNDGNRKADRIRVAEVVPAGMQFETASDGGKYDENLRAVVWTVGPLAPGADKSLTVNYVAKETGTHATKITATGSAGSTAAVQSTVDVIGKPELQMETLSATGAVTLGERITSKFQLNNSGTAAAKNVQLRIKLPRELKLISVKGAKFQQTENGILFETIGELPPHTKAAYELVLEPIAEADAQIALEISAEHLNKPGKRVETIQIARDALK